MLWGPMWGPLAACAARRAGDWSCPPPLRSTYKLSSMQSPTFSGLRHHTAACFICMKWTVSRDFLPLVFFMILIHLGPVFNAEVLLFSHILYCSFEINFVGASLIPGGFGRSLSWWESWPQFLWRRPTEDISSCCEEATKNILKRKNCNISKQFSTFYIIYCTVIMLVCYG